MVAVYKGNKYKFVSNKRRKEIITRCVQKTGNTFLKENDIYYKPIDKKDLSDIYATEFYIFFDAGLKGVSSWWKVSEADLSDDKVKLRFAEGILPGWNIEEKMFVRMKLILMKSNMQKLSLCSQKSTEKKKM